MQPTSVIRALGALAQEHRLAAFRLLVQTGAVGMAAGAIAERLGVPSSSMSFHLAQLANAGLITSERRSRSIIYFAAYDMMSGLIGYLTENCCGGKPCLPETIGAPDGLQNRTESDRRGRQTETDMAFNVLVLCTGNSARSILGEAIFAQVGSGRIAAFSAGSKPKGVPHPGALRLLARKGIDTAPFRSKSWNEFTGPGAPHIDLAITVCGNAAGEACPVFPGTPLRAHWGLPDPADVSGSEAEVDAAFEQTWRWLTMRVEALLALPFEAMDRIDLQARLGEIGRMEGAA